MKYLTIFTVVLLLNACTTPPVNVEPFSVNLDSPRIPLGTIEAQLDRFFNMGGINRTNFTVYYFPLEDAVCLQYRNDFITYHLFFNSEGRTAFLRAFEQYNQDFEQRTLSGRNSKRATRKYGRVEGFLAWQTTRISVRARGNPEIEFGYRFRNTPGGRAAFFTINQRQTFYEDPIARDNNRTSPDIMIYFTRAQAENLAEIFNPLFLQSVRPGGGSAGESRTDIDFDVY
jgi:hypothetical protein